MCKHTHWRKPFSPLLPWSFLHTISISKHVATENQGTISHILISLRSHCKRILLKAHSPSIPQHTALHRPISIKFCAAIHQTIDTLSAWLHLKKKKRKLMPSLFFPEELFMAMEGEGEGGRKTFCEAMQWEMKLNQDANPVTYKPTKCLQFLQMVRWDEMITADSFIIVRLLQCQSPLHLTLPPSLLPLPTLSSLLTKQLILPSARRLVIPSSKVSLPFFPLPLNAPTGLY